MPTFSARALVSLLVGSALLAATASRGAGQLETSKTVLILPEVPTMQNIKSMLYEIKAILLQDRSDQLSTNVQMRIIDTTNCLYLEIVEDGVAISLTVGNRPKTVSISHFRPLKASRDDSKRFEALNELNHRFPLMKFTVLGQQTLRCQSIFYISEGVPPRQIADYYEQFWQTLSEFRRTLCHPHFESLDKAAAQAPL